MVEERKGCCWYCGNTLGDSWTHWCRTNKYTCKICTMKLEDHLELEKLRFKAKIYELTRQIIKLVDEGKK